MILDENEIDHFDHDFEDWEKNRMYPPSHTGESMTKVNDSHLKAIARAIHFMRSGITAQMTPKFRDSIELDITKLDEIHKFCRQQIIEPGLPMVQDTIEVGDIGEKVGDKGTTPAN